MFGWVTARAVAILIVWSPFILGDPSTALAQYQVDASSPTPIEPWSQAPAAVEPFGLPVEPVTFGQVLSKWNGLVADISAERDILARCRDDADTLSAGGAEISCCYRGRPRA